MFPLFIQTTVWPTRAEYLYFSIPPPHTQSSVLSTVSLYQQKHNEHGLAAELKRPIRTSSGGTLHSIITKAALVKPSHTRSKGAHAHTLHTYF